MIDEVVGKGDETILVEKKVRQRFAAKRKETSRNNAETGDNVCSNDVPITTHYLLPSTVSARNRLCRS